MTAVNAEVGPVAGFALTATMCSETPSDLSTSELKRARLDYYEYMFTDMGGSKICVMQDIDKPDSVHGPFWGEFNTRVHRAMGFRGIVTNGCVRDVGKLPRDILILCCGLRPSHANLRVLSFSEPVNIFGMTVSHGDIVHTDEHGAVTFPAKFAREVAAKAREFVAMEAPIIEACKNGELTLGKLQRLYLARTR
jgi:regulator of RNase E activity RraA